jgi:excisionase family DNA binding protein
MPELGDVLTVAQAAQELGLTREAIRGAIHRRLLTTIQLDARTRVIPRSAVERYRADHQTGRGRPPKSRTQPAQPAEGDPNEPTTQTTPRRPAGAAHRPADPVV